MHDPRGKKSLALAYALADRGPHGSAARSPRRVHPDAIRSEGFGLIEPVKMLDFDRGCGRTTTRSRSGALQPVGMCDFVDAAQRLGLEQSSAMNSVTGWNMSSTS
jgi:hypothetical protein